jgi:AraC family transcriptional regulator, regulatory protein of adaptative response / methylphosphotriester-DNA alkyltransferase methyltransferase
VQVPVRDASAPRDAGLMGGEPPRHTSYRDGTLERRRALLAEAEAAIRADHGIDVSLASVARQVNCSPRHLQRVYQELSDRTFRDSLRRARVESACALLEATDLRLREVAVRVGYRQPAEFSRAFRAVMGMPPGLYRRQHAARD